MKWISTFCSILLLPLASMAGTRGYNVYLINIGDQDFFKSQTYRAYRDGDFPSSPQLSECWNSRATGGERVALFARNKIPKELSSKMVKAIWSGDIPAKKRAQKIISKEKTPDKKEFDGLLILKAANGNVSVMALGAKEQIGSNIDSKKISAIWNEMNPNTSAADLDLATCKASKSLDFHFNP